MRSGPKGLRRFLAFMRTAMEVSDTLARIIENANRTPRAQDGRVSGSDAAPQRSEQSFENISIPISQFEPDRRALVSGIEASARRHGRSS